MLFLLHHHAVPLCRSIVASSTTGNKKFVTAFVVLVHHRVSCCHLLMHEDTCWE
jgi:hypothetical protein